MDETRGMDKAVGMNVGATAESLAMDKEGQVNLVMTLTWRKLARRTRQSFIFQPIQTTWSKASSPNFTNKCPLDYFHMFCNDGMMDTTCENTNTYYAEIHRDK